MRRDVLFANCAPLQLARVLGKLEPVAFAAGQDLYARGAKADALYLLDAGDVELVSESGRRVELLAPRCGEEAATDLKTYLATATARTPVQALRLAARSPGRTRTDVASDARADEPSERRSPVAGTEAGGGPARRAATAQGTGGMVGGAVGAAPVVFAGGAAGLTQEAALFVGILAATVLMWLFGLADEYVPPLLAITAVLMVGLVPSDIALGGFSSRTLTMLIGVYALASLIGASGLSYRVMTWPLIRLPDTPFWQQTALLLSGYALSPIMPSGNARLSLLQPLYRDMVSGLSLKPQGAAAVALMAAMFSGAMLFSPMLLTSKSSNLTVFGMLPAQVQEQFQGVFWLVAAAVAVVVVTLTHAVAIRLSFAREPQTPLPKARLREQQALLGPVTMPEKGALLGFVLFVAGVFTISWHQINPAWLAAFILVALLLTGLVSKKDFQQKIDWPMIFFLLSLEGLSRSISYLGLDTALSAAVGDRFDFVGGNLMLFIPVALAVTLVLRLALPITAGMVVAAVVLMPVAAAQNIHPWVLAFLTAMFSDMWFKPYQSSQCLQLASSGYASYIADPGFRRYNHFMNASRIVAAYASVPYWQWLGLA